MSDDNIDARPLPDAIPKFIAMLRQHDFEIMAFFSDNEFLRTAVIYSLRTGVVMGIRLDEGVFDTNHLTSDISHFITQPTDQPPQSSVCLYNEFRPSITSLIESANKEGDWKEWAIHFFDKSHLLYQPLFSNDSLISPPFSNNENSSNFLKILDFPTTYTGFLLLLPFEQFCKAKTTLHTLLPQLFALFQDTVSSFTTEKFNNWQQEYDFVTSMKSFSFLSASPTQLQTFYERKQRLYTILNTVHHMIRNIQRELYSFEEDSMEWTFQESMDCARRKRELYKHLDKLRLLCKHGEEMLWILSVHISATLVNFLVLQRKLEKTVSVIQEMVNYKGGSTF
jgi:hypothetical protein